MTENTTEWLTHKEVQEKLRINNQTLRKLMNIETPDVPQPWRIFGGSARRPLYRWNNDELSTWWYAVCEKCHQQMTEARNMRAS